MLAYLRGRILTETNRERKEKLEKRFEIKSMFVERLKSEIENAV